MPKQRRRKNAHDLAQLETEYSALAPVARRFANEVAHQLEILLANNSISLTFPMQHRVKTWTSVVEKLSRVSMTLASLRELQDLVGFRLVLQFRRDVDSVCRLIGSAFDILDKYEAVSRLREDQFGYSSTHFIVQLPSSWLAVPALVDMGGIRAEIQVRTTAQHIWATASHTLQYKNEASVPPLVRRAIYRVSALLETVDLEFERVLQERDNYIKSIGDVAQPEEPLNVDLLQQVLSEVWPEANSGGPNEPYAGALDELVHFGINTRRKLERLLAKHRDAVLAADAAKVVELRDSQEGWAKTPMFQERFAKGVFWAHVGLTGSALRMEVGEDALKEYRQTRSQSRPNA